MKYLNLKTLITGLATFLMSGIIADQALAVGLTRPVISSASSKSCVVGLACSYQITATNNPTSYSATPVPAGMAVNTSTGLISGTPASIGTTSSIVSATNSSGTGRLTVAFTITASPAKVVVAPSGGNYTTITAALAGINPSATNPCVIEVWPGVYNEPSIVHLKSYVHLKGSGRDVTTVQRPDASTTDSSGNIIEATGLTNVTVSGLTVTGGWIGIAFWSSTSGTISENSVTNAALSGILFERTVGTISDNSASNNLYGILVEGYLATTPLLPPDSVRITGNKVSGNRFIGIYLIEATAVVNSNVVSGNGNGSIYNDAGGMELVSSGNSIISGNTITANNSGGVNIRAASIPTISGNVITDNLTFGVKFPDVTDGGSVTNNKIVANGGTLFTDVVITDGGSGTPIAPNISFNIFDDITGTRGVGSFNVNSSGDPILVP